MDTLFLEHFDTRRVWCRYSGQTWGTSDAEKARAIRDARRFYERFPHVYIGGVRLVNRAGRIVWSLAAKPTFRLEIDWGDGDGWEGLWGKHALSSRDAEYEREREAEMLDRPVRIVQENYPRESPPVTPVTQPTFSAPNNSPAAAPAHRPVPVATFTFGEESAA